MCAGIYILYYESDDGSYYIGQSINIEGRYKEHCKKLRNAKHINKNLTKGFINNVYPSIHILEKLEPIEDILNDREIFWIKEYDSFISGMNATLGGEGASYGENHFNAKYSEATYLNILKELALDFNSISSISHKLNVSESIVHAISSGDTHKWLATLYPELYLSMQNRKKKLSGCNDLAARGITYPKILSPDGVEYVVTNIREFAKLHGLLNQDLGKVLRKDRKSTKGWKLA